MAFAGNSGQTPAQLALESDIPQVIIKSMATISVSKVGFQDPTGPNQPQRRTSGSDAVDGSHHRHRDVPICDVV